MSPFVSLAMRHLVLVAVLASSQLIGCAAGYRYGVASHHFSANTEDSSPLPSEEALSVGTQYHTFRLVDTTGLLMSGLVNVSRQYIAAYDAWQEAEDRVDSDGDGQVEVDYSWKPYGIYPGARVIADLRLGNGQPTLRLDGDDSVEYPDIVKYWGFDVVGEFWQFAPAERVRGTLFFASRAEHFDYDGDEPYSIGFNSLMLDVTFGAGVGTWFDQAVVTGSAELGMFAPIMWGLLGDDDYSPLAGQLSVEGAYYVLPALAINAVAAVGQYPDYERQGRFMRGSLGLVYEFGQRGDTPPVDDKL